MSAYQYRAVPAPRKGKPGRGVKGGAAKFANAVSDLMNQMGLDGWEYLRADTLPCEERQGLTSKTIKYHSMLVFRRPVEGATAEELEEEPLALEHHEDVSEAEPETPTDDPVDGIEHAQDMPEDTSEPTENPDRTTT